MYKKRNDINSLEAPFKSAIVWMIYLIEKQGLPLIVYETYRGPKRQEELKKRGASKAAAGQSPHNHGLACDFVLDTNRVKTQEREWNGKMYKDAWDYETPEAKATYDALGRLAESLGLEWGGRWDFIDVPHVQLAEWKEIVKS